MKFSELKLHAMNAVKWYFNRNWGREDLMKSGKVKPETLDILNAVYYTFFYVMFCSTIGSYLHLFWEVGGLFTVLCSLTSLLWLYFTPPWRLNQRRSLLMIYAFSFGASVGLLTKYLFEMHQNFVASFFAGTTVGIAYFMFQVTIITERSHIYHGGLLYCCLVMLAVLLVIGCLVRDSYTVLAILKGTASVILFLGYFVVYSQEIFYDISFGDIDFINRALTVFFNLPAIVLHAARVCLPFGAKVNQKAD